MTIEEELINARVAAEDIVASLEGVIAAAGKAVVKRPARQIAAENHELFQTSLAMVYAASHAQRAKLELLAALGLPNSTQLTPPPAAEHRLTLSP